MGNPFEENQQDSNESKFKVIELTPELRIELIKGRIFEKYEEYKNQPWFKEFVLKAVENSDGAGAFFENIQKYKNESWAQKLVKIREVVEKLRPDDFFIYLQEDTYLNEPWVKEMVLKAVENWKGAEAFFQYSNQYKGQSWFKDKEAALKAVENWNGTWAFFQYSNQYQNQPWFKEVILKAVESRYGAVAFFEYSNQYKDQPWFKEIALKAVENSGGVETFLKNYKTLDFKDNVFKEKLFRLVKSPLLKKYQLFFNKVLELGFTEEEFLDNPIIGQEELEECLGSF